MIALMVATMLVLVVMEVPIAFALGIAALVYIVPSGLPAQMVAQRFFSVTQSFPFLAVPFFILMGQLMVESGLTRRIINLASRLVGFLPGGLALVSVVSNMIMAGVSGSSVGDAAAIGSVIIPGMRDEGYDRSFACALNASASVMGIIIPPSSTMVILGWIANLSVAKLFLGGAIPGILIGLSMFALTIVVALRRGYPRGKYPTGREVVTAVRESVWVLLLPLVIVGFLVFGIATPTETAAIGAGYALVIGCLVYRTLSWRQIWKALKETVASTVVVMLVVCTSTLFTWVLVLEHVPEAIARGLLGISANPAVILFLIEIMLLVAGMIMDIVPNLLLFVPVLFPVAQQLGLDPIHFGVTLVVTLAIGLFTPPVGTTLFVSCRIANTRIDEMYQDLIPYFLLCSVVALLVAFVPALSTWLPNLLIANKL